MKTLTAGMNLGIALTALAASMAGCASRTQESAKTATAGAAMQQNGIMSQSDYVRLDGLARTVSQTHTISDTDMNWTLTQLSTEKNSIARARAFNILAEIRPVTAAQKAKILPAITPYLSSADELDHVGALRVQKAVQSNG